MSCWTIFILTHRTDDNFMPLAFYRCFHICILEKVIAFTPCRCNLLMIRHLNLFCSDLDDLEEAETLVRCSEPRIGGQMAHQGSQPTHHSIMISFPHCSFHCCIFTGHPHFLQCKHTSKSWHLHLHPHCHNWWRHAHFCLVSDVHGLFLGTTRLGENNHWNIKPRTWMTSCSIT